MYLPRYSPASWRYHCHTAAVCGAVWRAVCARLDCQWTCQYPTWKVPGSSASSLPGVGSPTRCHPSGVTGHRHRRMSPGALAAAASRQSPGCCILRPSHHRFAVPLPLQQRLARALRPHTTPTQRHVAPADSDAASPTSGLEGGASSPADIVLGVVRLQGSSGSLGELERCPAVHGQVTTLGAGWACVRA